MRTHYVTCQVICEQHNRAIQWRGRDQVVRDFVCALDILYDIELVL